MSEHSKMNKDEQFLLKIVQPSLLGFMDGSISTLAPVFGFAVSGDAKTAFMAGTLVSVGAGISMGQAEAISDDGKLTGRGSPVIRGIITGVATFIGGMLHTLPFLIDDISLILICKSGLCDNAFRAIKSSDSRAFTRTSLSVFLSRD